MEKTEYNFEVECAICHQRYVNHSGSTPCCGSIAYLVKDDGTAGKDIIITASVNGGPFKPLIIGEHKQ